MKKINFNFDRTPLTEEAINAKQNFEHVLKAATAKPKLSWSKMGYYGTVGIASFAAAVGIFKLIQINQNANDNKATLYSQSQLINDEQTLNEHNIQLAYNPVSNDADLSFEEIGFLQTEKAEKAIAPEVVSTLSKEKANVETPIKEEQKIAVSVEEHKTPVSTEHKTIQQAPVIAGVSKGAINWNEFRNNEIYVGENQVVKQFSIQYTAKTGDRTVTVMGSRISPEVEKELLAVGLNQKVFITNILSESSLNASKRLLSMELDVHFK